MLALDLDSSASPRALATGTVVKSIEEGVCIVCRTSRDRSMFPKIDMASEKAMIEKWTPPEVADGHRGLEGSQDIEVLEEKAKNSSEVRGEPLIQRS